MVNTSSKTAYNDDNNKHEYNFLAVKVCCLYVSKHRGICCIDPILFFGFLAFLVFIIYHVVSYT